MCTAMLLTSLLELINRTILTELLVVFVLEKYSFGTPAKISVFCFLDSL